MRGSTNMTAKAGVRSSQGQIAIGAALLGAGILLTGCGSTRAPETAQATVPELPECGGTLVAANDGMISARTGDDTVVRRAAQRGLAFLGEDTLAWQSANNCYGCHVQAVTLDAFIVGRNHHYDVPDAQFNEVLRGLLDISGGARGPNGFSVGGDPSSLIESSQSFGGAAIAEYDEHISPELENVLLATAETLLGYQNADGSVRSTDRRPPIVAGEMQSTTQAARTWRQAHARTANDTWLAPIGRAEQYIRSRATQLTDQQQTYLQDLNYGIIGLLAAGAAPNEGVVTLLGSALRERQNEDGGWGFTPGEASDAFATGQSVYVLKQLGLSDRDRNVARGIDWLVQNQQENGGWSTGGDRRGEAMWAVLGLVSVDLLSVEVRGMNDGTHLGRMVELETEARDGEGVPASRIEIRVDDIAIGRACEGTLSVRLDPAQLEPGAHRVDVIASNQEGRESRRRLTFYSGDHYLTQIGSRFEGGLTAFSLRNVAEETMRGRVRLEIFPSDEAGDAGARVYEATVDGVAGAMSLSWGGVDTSGEPVAGSRFIARLSYLDRAGEARHTVSLPFVHDTEEAQAERFGQVAGSIDLADEAMEGATVELVDEDGSVVQSTSTTRSGRYRFRSVEQGNYRVRVRRGSLGVREAEVHAAPATEAGADMAF